MRAFWPETLLGLLALAAAPPHGDAAPHGVGCSMTGILDRIDAGMIEPQRLAGAVVDRVLIDRRKRDYTSRALTAREALQALAFEAMLVSVAAQNLAQGMALGDADLTRLLLAWSRIDTIATEAGA